jgi:hypothetical protein
MQQDRASRHLVAGLKRDLVDHAGGLCRKIRAAQGAHAADRLELLLPGRGDGHRGRYGLWRHRHRAHALAHRDAAGDAVGENAADDQQRADDNDNDRQDQPGSLEGTGAGRQDLGGVHD